MVVDVIWGYEFWDGCFGWLESGWPPRMVRGERSLPQEKSLVEVDGSQCGATVETLWNYSGATLKPIWAKLLQDDGEITFGRGQDWMDFLTVVESWVGYTS